MAINTITIEFDPCNPPPANGYRVSYRPLGSEEDHRVWPENFTSSPAVIDDDNDPLDTEYEGFIQGDCGDGELGIEIAWATAVEDDESTSDSTPPESLRIVNNLAFNSITGIFTIPADGLPGDARAVSAVGGYPIGPGEQVDGTIHPDHAGDSNLEVIVYFTSAVFGDTTARVTDSDNFQGCNAGTLVAVIGVTGPFRLSNIDGWQIVVSSVPC